MLGSGSRRFPTDFGGLDGGDDIDCFLVISASWASGICSSVPSCAVGEPMVSAFSRNDILRFWAAERFIPAVSFGLSESGGLVINCKLSFLSALAADVEATKTLGERILWVLNVVDQP